MAYNIFLIVLLVLFSLSVTSVYSLSTRDAISKQDDESYFMATTSGESTCTNDSPLATTSDQRSSMMIDVEDLAKARSLQALVDGSKVAVKKKSKTKSSKKHKKKKKYHKIKKVGSLAVSALVGIIIAIIVVTIVIICVLYFFFLMHKAKKAQGHEKTKGSSETQTSKTEDHV
ncbi:hypothetical protein AALP_AA1G078400 [Arabis alpina]|uniref:Transmembrane protein n=1 Tax=Arabis alpina TaxID=50452 RepID=A0A087HLT9_ARAAL|nr:hypothetical protein AALP_AA1G078400 [Arabis alpina]